LKSPPHPDWQEQLQSSLRRAQQAISVGATQQQEMVQAWTDSLRSAYPDWGRERWQRRLERKLRRKAEREARIANASLLEGYMWLLAAIVLFIVALTELPFLWWLMFPAFGLASRGTRVIARNTKMTRPITIEPGTATSNTMDPQARARAQRFGSLGGAPVDGASQAPARAPPSAPPAPGADPRDVRVDGICDRILGELRSAPAAVREIFRKPEETIAALRSTCRDLTRRDRELRKFLSTEDDLRLVRERDALQKRIEVEADEVTKLRLSSALAALEAQREQRVELARSAARFDAEHTRIAYTLESLHTQIVRMRSSDSASVDVAGAGLRRSLDLLSQEVDALADALEKVNRGEAEKLQKVAEAPAAESGAGQGPRTQREKA
jgi:hypothetical protein